MDAVDDSLQYNIADDVEEKEDDEESVSSGESFEAIPDNQDSDEDLITAAIPPQLQSQPKDDATSHSESTSEASEDAEDTTWINSSMTKSDIEVLNTTGAESMTTSEYVVAEDPTKSLEASLDPEEMKEVADMLESFLKPINDQHAVDGIEVIEDVSASGDFPNLEGAGDHSRVGVDIRTVESQPPAEVVTTSGAAKLKNVPPVVDLTGDSDLDGDYEDDDDDFEDETIAERLWGLTEMFPESVRKGSQKVFNFSLSSTKFCYTWGRKALWVVSSSFIILYLPVLIESERVQIEKESLGQAQDVLLGSTNQSSNKGVDQSAPPMPTVSLPA